MNDEAVDEALAVKKTARRSALADGGSLKRTYGRKRKKRKKGVPVPLWMMRRNQQ